MLCSEMPCVTWVRKGAFRGGAQLSCALSGHEEPLATSEGHPGARPSTSSSRALPPSPLSLEPMGLTGVSLLQRLLPTFLPGWAGPGCSHIPAPGPNRPSATGVVACSPGWRVALGHVERDPGPLTSGLPLPSSGEAAGPKQHPCRPGPGARSECRGAAPRPGGLPGGACGCSDPLLPGHALQTGAHPRARPGCPALPRPSFNFALCLQAAASSERRLRGFYPLFLYHIFFSFLNPFKSLGRMGRCRERSCVTELRGSRSPKNRDSCHSGWPPGEGWACPQPRSSDVPGP